MARWSALLLFAARCAAQRPICQMADAFAASVDMHLTDWDSQVEFALNESVNCSDFLEYVYLSRDQIRTQLDYVRGNFSAEDEQFRLQGAVGGSSAWAMTHMSQAASLLSAHIHIHGILSAARPECLNEHLQLLFLMSLRRMKGLLHSQLRHLWLVFQGTAELVRQHAGKWLAEVVDLFEADLRTYESIMVNWRPANDSDASARPGPPLPAFAAWEDGALSTIEVLRRDTFEEWEVPKLLLRVLLRLLSGKPAGPAGPAGPGPGGPGGPGGLGGADLADFCAGAGAGAVFLNDTGLVKAYAFDASTNIKLLSKNLVEPLRLHAEDIRPWKSFDVTMCLTDFASRPEAWVQVWKNIEVSTKSAAVMNCGDGEARHLALKEASMHASALAYDDHLSSQLSVLYPGLCIFWRSKASS